MTDLMRFNASDLPALLERLNKNSIGMDEYFDRIFKVHESTQNYPPYNVIQLNNVETVLELALAGFKQDEVNVYTEYGKLFVEGTKTTRRMTISTSTVELLKDHLREHGQSQTIRRLHQSALKMGY